MEPVILRRPEDAHHPGRSSRADQRRDHPALGLGHLPAYTGGPQAAPALLPGSSQRHRLPSVSVAVFLFLLPRLWFFFFVSTYICENLIVLELAHGLPVGNTGAG